MLKLLLVVFLTFTNVCSLAQTVTENVAKNGLVLKPSSLLSEKVNASNKSQAPSFFESDRLSGQTDINTHFEGSVSMRRADTVIRADEIDYDSAKDLLSAQGNVRINKAGNIYQGPTLNLKVEAFEGDFLSPSFSFLRNGAYGQAERIEFMDAQHAKVHQTTFTTCQVKPGPSWLPDWILKAQSIDINNETSEGQANGASLQFKGIPILPIPSMSFPLSSDRKSGFLPPTLGLDSIGGLEYTQPYYWNIAPNRDATFQATTWSKRGVNFGSEFRYLEHQGPDERGTIRLDYMQHDLLRDKSRWGYSQTHQGGLEILDQHLGLNLNIKRVSDDYYWRDFPRATNPLTERLLPGDVSLNWTAGDWNSNLRSLRWQTLQDLTAPITPPFDRVPQWTTRYRPYLGNLQFSMQTDVTKFQADRTLACQAGSLDCQPNGQRALLISKLSYPVNLGFGTITPKLSLLNRAYEFDRALSNGQTQASVVVPTFSLDATTVFERPFSWGGQSYTQTLEPRFFYVNTPYRKQNFLPVYDTGRNDFNFATVYTENAFSGYDRVSDDRLLTMGASTRLISQSSGEERARFGIAQRFRFADPLVTLPSDVNVSKERLSDTLLGASVNMATSFTVDSTLQYNPSTKESMQTKVGGRFYPSNYRLLSAAYSFQRDVNSEMIDLAWQWPLNDLWGKKAKDLGPGKGLGEDQWFSVGRLNFDAQNHALVNAIVGMEYDAGCWLGRVVFERLQVATNQSNQRIMFQLEFVGFTKVGINPLQTLKDNIPRYQNLRETMNAPSRFGNYD